ncbi:hypothetical protein RCL1_007609 [Eukaryota sp. TZLM3-RCL]
MSLEVPQYLIADAHYKFSTLYSYLNLWCESFIRLQCHLRKLRSLSTPFSSSRERNLLSSIYRSWSTKSRSLSLNRRVSALKNHCIQRRAFSDWHHFTPVLKLSRIKEETSDLMYYRSIIFPAFRCWFDTYSYRQKLTHSALIIANSHLRLLRARCFIKWKGINRRKLYLRRLNTKSKDFSNYCVWRNFYDKWKRQLLLLYTLENLYEIFCSQQRQKTRTYFFSQVNLIEENSVENTKIQLNTNIKRRHFEILYENLAQSRHERALSNRAEIHCRLCALKKAFHGLQIFREEILQTRRDKAEARKLYRLSLRRSAVKTLVLASSLRPPPLSAGTLERNLQQAMAIRKPQPEESVTEAVGVPVAPVFEPLKHNRLVAPRIPSYFKNKM